MNWKKEDCIYGKGLRCSTDFSIEHILPRALGGNLGGDFFVTDRVCSRCNNLSGLFIDGPVIKNWFVQNYNHELAMQYLDVKKVSALPLVYLCNIEDLSSQTETCEFWLGPRGENIFFFRPTCETRYDAYIQGDPIKRRKQPGYAFFFATSSNEFSLKASLLSFNKQFPKAKRYSGNITFGRNETRELYFDTMPEELSPLLTKIKEGGE